MKITYKVPMLFSGMLIATVLTVSAVGYNVTKRSLRQAILSGMRSTLNLRAEKIEFFFKSIRNNIIFITEKIVKIGETPHNEPLTTEKFSYKIHKKLIRMLKKNLTNKEFRKIYFVDKSGKILKLYPSLEPVKEFPTYNLELPLNLKKKKLLLLSHLTDSWVRADSLHFAVPIFYRSAFNGLIIWEISTQHLFYRGAFFGKTGEILLASKRHKLVLSLYPIPNSEGGKAVWHFPPLKDGPLALAISGKNGSGISVDYRGVKVLAVWRYLPSIQWGMVAKLDLKEAFSPIYNLQYLTLFGSIALLLLSLSLTFSFTKRLLSPIQHLVNVTKEISDGNLSLRVNLPSNDEFGELAKSFNQMADNLKREREILEQRVAQRTEELRRANTELKNFTYLVSHDLQAPLISIKGFIQELKLSLSELTQLFSLIFRDKKTEISSKINEILKRDIPQFVEFIEKSSEKLESQIDAILQLSRLGYRPLSIEKVNLNQLISEILQSFTYQIEEKSVSIDVKDLPTVKTDRSAAEKIFSNVIGNAIKYLDPQRPGKIEIFYQQDSDFYLVIVKDNGIGIPPEEKEKVFQLFKRGRNATPPGNGVGLAFSKALIKRLGGDIYFRSQPNFGTTFFIKIPKGVSSDEK